MTPARCVSVIAFQLGGAMLDFGASGRAHRGALARVSVVSRRVLTRRVSAALLSIVASAAAPMAEAQERTFTRTLTCAALKSVVARKGGVVLASSERAYETVYRDGGACKQDGTGEPAFEPTADEPLCFAGWRCRQRNSDNNVN